jgi:hypothetical protein
MRRPVVLVLFTLSLTAASPLIVFAQDQQGDHRDQPAERRDDRHPPDDQLAKYRHDHPKASARCHDGFFTSTADHNRACSKHGGIDAWLR